MNQRLVFRGGVSASICGLAPTSLITLSWLVVSLSGPNAAVAGGIPEPIKLFPPALQDAGEFGVDLAASGDVIAATEYIDKITIFRRNGAAWTQEQQIDAGGVSLAVDNDTLVIGPPGRVYRFDGAVWELEDSIGGVALSLDVTGDLIAAGGFGEASVFRRVGGTWEHEVTLTTTEPFIHTVAIEGDVLAVASRNMTWVYQHSGGTWQEVAAFPLDNLTLSEQGNPVALDDGILAVSSLRNERRIVQIFEITPGGATLLQEIVPPDGSDASAYSAHVALDSGRLLIGTWDHLGSRGSAWMYRYCDGVFTVERFLPAPDESHMVFGWQVAFAGAWPAVAAPWENSGGFNRSGAVYAYPAFDDCNQNSVPDGCERLADPSLDCDANWQLDACESNADCNVNGQFDRCDIAALLSEDCNANGVPDECDIAEGILHDADLDGIADECLTLTCQQPAGGPVVSLKGVQINQQAIAPRNEISISPGDVLTSELYLSCWGSVVDLLEVYQVVQLTRQGATSGTFGTVLPVGWDQPLTFDPCPCDDPRYPNCHFYGYCYGNAHDPGVGTYISSGRPAYVFYGFGSIPAVDVSNIEHFRFGATTTSGDGPDDTGLARYLGTLELRASPDACGTFTFRFSKNENQNFVGNNEGVETLYTPAFEDLVVHVCMDDGLFCNGLETCSEQTGCQIVPPPSCDDGVACTVDSCDEAADGCDHALNHDACDDGNGCTRDECTPTGCVHIDDQCGDIPAASSWGLAVLALCLLIGAKLHFAVRHSDCR